MAIHIMVRLLFVDLIIAFLFLSLLCLGKLVSCNLFMNICLRDVICTSRDGDRFWKIQECYIHGNSIKYLRIPDEVIDMVAEEEQRERKLVYNYFYNLLCHHNYLF